MPSKNKPSIWQKLSHAPSRSYADAAPAHPSRPGRGPSPYSAPSTSLTSGALAAAEKAHREQQRQADAGEGSIGSYAGASARVGSTGPSSREPQPQQQQRARRSAGPRKQTLQYNEAESRFMMMDDPVDEGATEQDASVGGGSDVGGGSTQWRHPSQRMASISARSDVGPVSAAAPLKSKRSSRRPVEQDEDGSAGRIQASQPSLGDRRRGSASDVPSPMPAATVIEHHHHYYAAPAQSPQQNGAPFAGPATAVYSSSPSSSQLGTYEASTPRAAAPQHSQQPAAFQSAVVLPTPPSSELGSPASSFPALGRSLGSALDKALLAPARSKTAAASWDSDTSDDEAAFYTPRSSMNFADVGAAPASVASVGDPSVAQGEAAPVAEASAAATPTAGAPPEEASGDSSDLDASLEDEQVDKAPDTPLQEVGAPVLMLQPPTPTTFPLHDGSSRRMASPGQAPGQEKNLFSEVSFHPARVAARQKQLVAAAPAEPLHIGTTAVDEVRAESPAPADYEYEYEYDEPQPPRPAFAARERNNSPSPPSSSPRASALYADDDDAYSGVLLYALQEEDEGPLPSPGLPGFEPPRQSQSAPNLSPATTPPLTAFVPSTSASSPHSGLPSLSGLRPASGHGHRAESVRSNVSSSSRYSQTSYASYANERDVPRPTIIPGPPQAPVPMPSNVSSPLSSPMRVTPPSSSHSRNPSGSPSRSSSYLKSPTYPSAGSALDSPPTAPSSLFSPAISQARYSNTPFLPRPTSALMHSYDMAGSYPSAPASVVSDSGHRPRKAQSSVGDVRQTARETRPMSVMSASPSEAGVFQRKRLMSEGASLRDVRTLPQLMGDVARGYGGTSMSGGSGYSCVSSPPLSRVSC